MKHSPASLLRAVAILLPALLGSRLAGADEWRFSVAPYLWVASLKVDSSLPDLPPATPPEVERFETKLTGGFMIAGQAQYGSFGLAVDYDWLRLNTASTHPGPLFSAVELNSNFYHTTVALTWVVPTDSPWHLQLLAGARFFSVSGEQVFTAGLLPGFTRSNDHSWTDAVIGANVHYVFDERWFATGRLLFGGLTGGSNSTVDALAGVGYQFNKSWSGLLGYRYLKEKFDQGAFTVDLTGQGFLLGVAYQF